MKRYRWKLLEPDEQAVRLLSESINVSIPVARALCNRGITTYDEARTFFRPSISSLSSPFLLQDMERAVGRVTEALRNGEKIMLYGDYDVDGTTGTALLYLYLDEQGADVSYYINDRFTEGYGLSPEGISFAEASGVTLIITVDCGIRADDAIARCLQSGIDVIVCDHHEPHELPPAFAILNPKVPCCTYPFRDLCGCAVAFLLVQALAIRLQTGTESWSRYLDLVAIATAADMVSLQKENRILVNEGLQSIRRSPRQSMKSMLSIMGLNADVMTMYHIAFGLAPRINAAGRMQKAQLAVEWLVSSSEAEAKRSAEELEQMNLQRRKIDSDIFLKADTMVEGHFASYCSSIVLYDEDWHLGVLGIVASRMLEKYYLPTIIMGNMNGKIKGSVRSVEGLNIYEVLQQCGDLLDQFGGHSQAAGITLSPENLGGFRKKFDEICSHMLPPERRQKELLIDASLKLEEITANFMNVLEQFSPYGYGNREPIFMTSGLVVAGKPRLLKEKHVKFAVRDVSGRIFDVIGFDRPDVYRAIITSSGSVFSLAYSLEKRLWNNREQWQLRLRDIAVENP
ncbi:MAG: single-stranded-DNA-specific exonuclease RecJ [Chlorobium sp.]|uniref:single-stranded-DNA-specific exonuclease RecJ n=1 Tax=Chlorobium sp. TaxID=1095 RepID=UPI0025C16EE4|nr:single-stranded-DNA-specific exonuclease RecJ [Chlorobium sp.]MCF8215326.1 single-stranded-DNA-specific exonuclease RecJ [Chlorobium sp.]MCF8270163.1 single-stranded-DNA-specific exonuclease RecJ [Chlorobium sp.]MCF8286533.1 single-stranded-DNA-specific exonuclease RecJ [Chlorobium sp.]MCF8290131.1 single-stranded-DNA-specific exonuclease RecJ [Chlorobium sp.]MCF8384203.1 single-stranded-DNA-specific exonuclease RecJ [Chlorobium sp.]